MGMTMAHSILRRMRIAQTAGSVVPPESYMGQTVRARAELKMSELVGYRPRPALTGLKSSCEGGPGMSSGAALAGLSSESGEARCCVVMARNEASCPVPLTIR
jgi:hypothetical protein